MAELEKLQVELQEAVRESEKLKVKLFDTNIYELRTLFPETSVSVNVTAW